MAYADKEYSVADAEPFELYDFIRGTWSMYLTTKAEQFYVNESQIYEPAPISRSKVRQGQELRKDSISLVVPRGHDLAAEFINVAPEETTSVTIRRLHRGLDFSEAVVRWKGRVIGAEPQGEKVEIICESLYTSMRIAGLRTRAELICQHSLYDSGCTVNEADHQVTDTIDSVSGSTVTMTAISGSYADGWFSGGILRTGDNSRFIVAHAGNTITLSRPLKELEAGLSVDLSPGCDRTMATCRDKFNNILNYLGFPWMPTQNPFQVSIK